VGGGLIRERLVKFKKERDGSQTIRRISRKGKFSWVSNEAQKFRSRSGNQGRKVTVQLARKSRGGSRVGGLWRHEVTKTVDSGVGEKCLHGREGLGGIQSSKTSIFLNLNLAGGGWGGGGLFVVGNAILLGGACRRVVNRESFPGGRPRPKWRSGRRKREEGRGGDFQTNQEKTVFEVMKWGGKNRFIGGPPNWGGFACGRGLPVSEKLRDKAPPRAGEKMEINHGRN